MQINEVIRHLESLAPLSFQESYDNCGLLTGSTEWTCKGILATLDCTDAIVDEAIARNCNLIVAHHPIIFGGLKKITGRSYVERVVIKAIKNDIAIYAIHTNLDNVMKGVNGKIAGLLGLKNLKVLKPREAQLKKLITYAPIDVANNVRNALFDAGGGYIGKYSECSFNIEGVGTFKPMEGADPHTGEIGKRHEGKELKIEVIFPEYLEDQLLNKMIEVHPYEEVAYEIIRLGNYMSDVGSGICGDLDEPLEEDAILEKIKDIFKLKVIKHTALTGKVIKRVGICGGSGVFLLPQAVKDHTDMYITSDIKYHEYFDAEGKLLLADIGHYESEQFTIDLLYDFLMEKSLNFAVLKSEVSTNPVHYFV